MFVYLLLFAGVFIGWSLGTNDGANAFGTAVATGVVKHRTAIIIISTFVIIGAALLGDQNITKLSEMALNNGVAASAESALATVGDQAAQNKLILKSALKAAIIFVCAGGTVFIMSFLKFPVSANQSIIGAIIGWGIVHADYSNKIVLKTNMLELAEFASTWLICPCGAALIAFVIVKISNKFIVPKLSKLSHYDLIVKIGYLVAGAMASFSIGMNSSATVTAFYYDGIDDGIKANLLESAKLAAIIGAIAIAIGVLTYSKKVMMTVGESIAPLTPIEGFLVIVAMALTVFIMGDTMGIPVSTSQAAVGAVVGAGLTKGIKAVNFGVFKNIAIAWVSSPLCAGILSFVIASCTKGYFAA